MATGIVRPNQDYATNWKGPHSANIDEEVEQPTQGDGSLCECDAKDDGKIEEFGMSTLSNVVPDSVSQIIVWIYGRAEDVGVQPTLDIFFEGGYETAQTCNFTTSDSWRSYTFGSLSGSQADLDALRVRFIAAGSIGAQDEWWLDTMYCEVTYTTVSLTPKDFIDSITGTDAISTPYREMGITDTINGADVFIIDYKALGFTDVANGTDVFNLLKEIGFVDTITGTDILTLTRPVYFADTLLGSDVVTNPYREVGVSDSATGTDTSTTPFRAMGFADVGGGADVLTLLQEMGFVDSALGTDVFEYEEPTTVKGFADTITGINSFVVVYREMDTTDIATGTDSFTVVFRDMSIVDSAHATDEFEKYIAGGDIVVFIETAPMTQITTNISEQHHITITSKDILQIQNKMEDLEKK